MNEIDVDICIIFTQGIPSFSIPRTIDRATEGQGKRSNESPLYFQEIPNVDNRKLEVRFL